MPPNSQDQESLDKDPNPRWAPLESTIKNLFALSGNRCAFPACKHSIIDDMGQVVAQVAHIRGVKPTAARHDKNVDPKFLREAENLLVLCGAHHIATNDATIYTVDVMKDMKRAHEQRFGGLVSGLRSDITDFTKTTVVRVPELLGAYAEAYELDTQGDADRLAEIRDEFIQFTRLLSRLTPDVRSVYSTIIDRGDEAAENEFEVTVGELAEVLALDELRLAELLAILSRHHLVQIVDGEGREGYHSAVTWVATTNRPGEIIGGPVVSEVRFLSETLGIPVTTLIVDLDWRALDGQGLVAGS